MEHYIKYGVAVRRDPGSKFSSQAYLKKYPDVAKAGVDPLLHYILYGSQEGRSIIDVDKVQVTDCPDEKFIEALDEFAKSGTEAVKSYINSLQIDLGTKACFYTNLAEEVSNDNQVRLPNFYAKL